MSDTPTFQSNPYASFDPSQWSNPYSLYQNSALPWPSSYVGMPTNAMGQPIAAPQGMTLNSTPQQAAPAAAQPAANNGAFSPEQAMRILQGTGQWGISPGTGPGQGGVNNQAALDRLSQLTAGYRPQAQAAQPAAQPAGQGGGSTMDYNTVLAMLANPGNPVTPGATVPQGGSSPMGPGVMQQFMANWSPAQSGPGSGFQQGFYKALKGMGY